MHRLVCAIAFAVIAFASTIVAGAEPQPLEIDLGSAVQMALKTSPHIGSASAYADMSGAQMDKARSALHPSLTAESGYTYLSKETLFGSTAVFQRDTVANRLAIQQLLYSGGQAQANLDRARRGYLAAGCSLRAVRSDVICGVATAYLRSKQTEEAIEVARASVRSLEAGFDAAAKMCESGIVTKSDVLRAQVALSLARESVITAENNHEAALAELKAAIGLPQSAPMSLAANASEEMPELPADSRAERPEIAAGLAFVQAAEAGHRAAKAGRAPSVALAADYFNQPTGSEFPRLSNTVQAGVVVRFNVFDAGLTGAGIREADHAVRKARQDLEVQKRRVELEQQSARLGLESANARVAATGDQVQAAEESLRVLEAGYNEGITPLTDLLSAEAALTAARGSRLAAVYDVRIAKVNFLRAFGYAEMLAR